jgi:cystathionine beta-lyase
MKYNFDAIINRQDTNAVSIDGFRKYLLDTNEVSELPYPDNELIIMWVADMSFATAPEIIEALLKRVKHGIFGYTEISDSTYKKAFTNWAESKYEWTINPDHIVTSQGVVPALYDLISYLCMPYEKILTLTPSYAYFKLAADFNGNELITSRLICENGSYFIDFDDIRKQIKAHKISLFVLCSPHNPTGRLWTNAELKELGEICLENNVVIIADEIHCDILRKGKKFTPMAKLFPDSDQIITCMAPSKTFNLAGFMFANIIIPNDDLRAKWLQKHHGSENPLSLTAAQAAYSHGQDWLDALTQYLDTNFMFLDNYLKENLPKTVFKIPEATYLAWIDVRAYFQKEEDLTFFFANKAGVLLEGGNMFVENGTGHIRLNLACPKSILEESLGRISEAIKRHIEKDL